MGIESEDGTLTGSIDVSKLDSIEPKSDEARAQLDVLKRDVQQGQEQVAADSERQNEGAVASNPLVEDVPSDGRDVQGVPVQEAGESQPEQPSQEQPQPAEQPAQQEPAQPEQVQQEQARRGRGRGV